MHRNRGIDSSTAFVWTFVWKIDTRHSHTAGIPASLAAGSVQSFGGENDACSCSTVLVPAQMSLHSPAQERPLRCSPRETDHDDSWFDSQCHSSDEAVW